MSGETIVKEPFKRTCGIPARSEEVRNAYFWWLCDEVDLSGASHMKSLSMDPNKPTYFMLALKLFNEEFIPLVPNDNNRCGDGMNLRYRFSMLCSSFNDYSGIEGPCSILEMLIGLAQRIDQDLMRGPEEPDRSVKWFWEMITNLGLETCTDDSLDYEKAELINSVIDNLSRRNIEYNGDGGLFPLANPKADQKTVEIWYQMQGYFMERYPFQM